MTSTVSWFLTQGEVVSWQAAGTTVGRHWVTTLPRSSTGGKRLSGENSLPPNLQYWQCTLLFEEWGIYAGNYFVHSECRGLVAVHNIPDRLAPLSQWGELARGVLPVTCSRTFHNSLHLPYKYEIEIPAWKNNLKNWALLENLYSEVFWEHFFTAITSANRWQASPQLGPPGGTRISSVGKNPV